MGVGRIMLAGVRSRTLSRDVSSEEGAINMAQVCTLPFNKVVEYEDFADPELVSAIRDVFRHEIKHFTPEFPKGAEYRKYWEIAMSVRCASSARYDRTQISSALAREPRRPFSISPTMCATSSPMIYIWRRAHGNLRSLAHARLA
jgi:hypothetical protein